MTRKRIIYIIGITIIVAAMVVIYYSYDPAGEASSFFPRCPMLQLTGYRCPGCGSQRAIHSLLTGDVSAAWHYNPLVIVVIPIIIFYFVADRLRTRSPRFYLAIGHPAIFITYIVAIVAWWILRNVYDV
ncbi:MAG: DUF2752 domain-containing protein [Muribaculaceae bacterium]|nr:DUF2752 domain-containing protein [Muribaculaceae bacterium]